MLLEICGVDVGKYNRYRFSNIKTQLFVNRSPVVHMIQAMDIAYH